MTKEISWHSFKGAHVGIIKDQIVCVVTKVDDLPCEGYHVDNLQSVFVSLDAAKIGAQEMIDNYFIDTKEPRKPDMLTRILTGFGEVINKIHAEETEAKSAK